MKYDCHFKENNLTAFVIFNFKQKFEFWKTCIYHNQLNNFLKLKEFSNEISGESNDCDCFIFYNKMCQHLEFLYNSVTQYFLNN